MDSTHRHLRKAQRSLSNGSTPIPVLDGVPSPAPYQRSTNTPVVMSTDTDATPVLQRFLKPSSGRSPSGSTPTKSYPTPTYPSYPTPTYPSYPTPSYPSYPTPSSSYSYPTAYNPTRSYPSYGSSSTSQSEADHAVLVPIFFGIVVAIAIGVALCLYNHDQNERRQRATVGTSTTAPAPAPVASTPTGPWGYPIPVRRDAPVPVRRGNETARVGPTTVATEVDLVKKMTPQQRQDYVKNFLRTEKFKNATKTKINSSGKFVVAQSSRNLSKGANESPACAICLEDFTDGEDICISQNKHCPHQYHLACAFTWLLTHQECPCCRRDYLTIGQTSSRSTVPPRTTPVPTAPVEDSTEEEITVVDPREDWNSIATVMEELRTFLEEDDTAPAAPLSTVIEESNSGVECRHADNCSATHDGSTTESSSGGDSSSSND